ncbi:hypothetical protein F1847_05950 [Thermodesulfobacterium sp. TA1]|uniref:hypothetical protein n=1 Tax=Thermodesulfobacterium sp. TA1 TaxID=2234087 RepID=UPI001231DFF2|nr:hypothetical protein [Thermodesulfobacterium sp. TA1]QER42306.1 hypothetical protein F1847_05950 [Thermodesulfobacterium sp. TA1]
MLKKLLGTVVALALLTSPVFAAEQVAKPEATKGNATEKKVEKKVEKKDKKKETKKEEKAAKPAGAKKKVEGC